MGYFPGGSTSGGEAKLVVYRQTLGQEEIENGFFILPKVPQILGAVLLFIRGAPQQQYGTDYIVTENRLIWNGLNIDGILSAGDKVTVVYQ
jgi:hypothetical protein